MSCRSVLKFKIEVCAHFLEKGRCPYGDKCIFSHLFFDDYWDRWNDRGF